MTAPAPTAEPGPAADEASAPAARDNAALVLAKGLSNLTGASQKAAKSRPIRRRARILPVLIVAAVTVAGLRAVEIVRDGNLSALLAGKSVDLGPGRPLLAQDREADPADGETPDAEIADTGMADAGETGEMEMAQIDMTGTDMADDGMEPAMEMAEAPVMTAQEALEKMEAEEAAMPSGGLSESEMDLLLTLSSRRGELDEREGGLDQREALLQAAEMRIDEKVNALEGARLEIESLLGMLEEAEEARLARLVQVYEIMKPAEAAGIFDGLDRDVLLSVMEKMNERKLAPILAAMNPALARELTADLSLKRRLPELPEG